ncbi:hypothetical protein [Fulvivirga kasyanovii]
MKKIILCLLVICGLSACVDESEEITPRLNDLKNLPVATDGDDVPTNHGQ